MKFLFAKNYRKSFTLIEIILVIAIVGILSLIAMPNFVVLLEKSRAKADEASLSSLNKATTMYAVLNNISSNDVFVGITSDEDRMQVLINNGLLYKKIEGQQKNINYTWVIEQQMWAFSDFGGFKFSDGSIDDYDISKGLDVVIPYKIGGIPVTEIAKNAFKDKGITSVIIPEGVTKIGENSFRGNKLTEIIIPNTVVSIGNGAFFGKGYGDSFGNQLTSVIIPENVTSIGDFSFRYNNLTSIIIPGNVKIIGRDAFTSNKLTSLVMEEGVTIIEDSAFRNNKLTVVIIPESVTSIGDQAFWGNGLDGSGGKENNIDSPARWEMIDGEWVKQ